MCTRSILRLQYAIVLTPTRQDAKFLISRQKYLELVEARKPTAALQVLRNELTPLNVDPDQLHMLSRSFSFSYLRRHSSLSFAISMAQFDYVYGPGGFAQESRLGRCIRRLTISIARGFTW